jgi:hypothetical protein
MQNIQVTGGTGTYITTTITKRKGMLVVSYDTSGGLVQWHVYVWDDVNLVWVDTTLPSHKHTGSGDGGELFEALVNNPNMTLFNDQYPKKSNWNGITSSGTGALSSDNASGSVIYMRLETGTTTTGYTTAWAGGAANIDCAYPLRFSHSWTISAITNVLFRFGVGVEDINAASDNNNKIGVEWCDAQPQSQYYTLSANSSSRSLVTSGVALAATTAHGVKMIYYPASKASYKFQDGTVYDKTGVLPSGVILDENSVRLGIKNNNGGSATRTWDDMGTFVVARNNFTRWVT